MIDLNLEQNCAIKSLIVFESDLGELLADYLPAADDLEWWCASPPDQDRSWTKASLLRIEDIRQRRWECWFVALGPTFDPNEMSQIEADMIAEWDVAWSSQIWVYHKNLDLPPLYQKFQFIDWPEIGSPFSPRINLRTRL